MKTLKCSAFIVIVFLLFCVLPAEERWPDQVTMEDLTNPSSPSYVPNPFPKTRAEIIENLKYHISKQFSNNSWEISLTDYINLLPELIKEKPGAVIGDIVKVKNRISWNPYPYSYLIFISDLKGKYTARVAMKANGLLLGGIDPSETDPGVKLKKFDKVIEKMSHHFRKQDVKTIERVAYGPVFADVTSPIYEITLYDGTVFYHDYRGKPYKKTKEIEFKGDMKNGRSMFVISERKKLKKDERYLFDWISQKFIVLKKIGKEK
jgi:hypothetical protein